MLRLRKIMARLRRFIGGLTPMQIIVLVFLAIILAGSGLLMLPVSAKNCEVTPFLTALFTATSCTCVTGLSLVDTGTYWSSFGHAVMLCLIQIGGLGFMTIVTVFFMAMRRKIGLKERLVMAQSLGMEDLSGIVTVVKKVLVRTMIVEGAGAVLLVIRFCFQMPFGKALWWGVFHSVSAFCNAGFDIMGHVEAGGSLMSYGRDPAVNLILMALIIVSGLGFFVSTFPFPPINLTTQRPAAVMQPFSSHTFMLIIPISGVTVFANISSGTYYSRSMSICFCKIPLSCHR